MIKVALIGAGKMGISHLSILGAHPDVEVVGVCDTSKMVNDFLSKYGNFNCFTEYQKMVNEVKPDAVVVAVPTKFHYTIIKDLLVNGIHVFAEKPFCLTSAQGNELVELAKNKGLKNQVGYHNKFVGTFSEVKRLVNSGILGKIDHFVGEAYGPVVIKPKQDTWRSDPSEGGGCLLDYASHVIDLINDILSPVTAVKGSLLKSIYSKNVEDSVYSLLELSNNINGILSVNWSDETYRKMSTSITINGSNGKIISDANELKVFLKDPSGQKGYVKGWNLKYITDLTPQVDFYLRGEEYSAQLDYFINVVADKAPNTINTFESAWYTDRAIELIKSSAK
ncbi:Gfo/Idh/MocA family protein [Mucilaginibacter boryungensis]|uniref:Gfo/Idh/MocA family oxidoreductase n=1 Tax=Mucilaginibacter boryungensis TaxID=768480 RepID=A0ABR9XKG6_9SPHI|nr:Gfo/Idh/MocA family oxidoreductase [Mucilaginibacter boryungensis]MBE9667883.1 Gfo/Idh/MocA family oxidoreductase [Mucilaginibacter boryungensis]